MKATWVLAVLCLIAGCAPAAPAPAPLGRWLSATGNVEVTIAPCGASLCGDVTRVFGNSLMESGGAAKVPPPTVGLRLMSGFHPAGAVWSGQIYNREQGRTYDCQISVSGADQLVVRPYIVVPLIGKTQIWRRMP